MTYIATLLKVEANANPEYAWVVIEASTPAQARKVAEKALEAEHLSDEGREWEFWQNNGWISYRDPELWGKPVRKVVDVVEESEHVSRSGKGNRRGTENQAEREARFRKAV